MVFCFEVLLENDIVDYFEQASGGGFRSDNCSLISSDDLECLLLGFSF